MSGGDNRGDSQPPTPYGEYDPNNLPAFSSGPRGVFYTEGLSTAAVSRSSSRGSGGSQQSMHGHIASLSPEEFNRRLTNMSQEQREAMYRAFSPPSGSGPHRSRRSQSRMHSAATSPTFAGPSRSHHSSAQRRSQEQGGCCPNICGRDDDASSPVHSRPSPRTRASEQVGESQPVSGLGTPQFPYSGMATPRMGQSPVATRSPFEVPAHWTYAAGPSELPTGATPTPGASTLPTGATPTPATSTPATPSRLPYSIDTDGQIIQDTRGMTVLSRMRQLMALTFRDEIYVDWRKQPEDRKQYILDTLRSEFPCPDGYAFSERFMLHRMSQWINHRRSEVRDAIREGKKRLSGCAKSDWEHMKREIESNPDKFNQQKEAAKKRQDSLGASHLGSGGKGHFIAYFRQVMNRSPSEEEYMYAYEHGVQALFMKLEEEGHHVDWAYAEDQDLPHGFGSHERGGGSGHG